MPVASAPGVAGRRFRPRAVVLAAVGGFLLAAGLGAAFLAFAFVASEGEPFGGGFVVARHGPIADVAQAPRVGECLAGFPEDTIVSARSGVVPCRERHGSEVIGIVTMPDATRIPGDDDLDYFAEDACRIAFGDYVGRGYDDSGLDFGAVPPTRAAWGTGDRSLFCLLDASTYHGGRGSARHSRA